MTIAMFILLYLFIYFKIIKMQLNISCTKHTLSHAEFLNVHYYLEKTFLVYK